MLSSLILVQRIPVMFVVTCCFHSLRINLDMAKLVYSWFIATDKEIPGTVVRSSTIPEELGRISYLLTDKTGTLTQNVMVFKKLHLGTVSFGLDSMEEVQTYLRTVFAKQTAEDKSVTKKTVSIFSSSFFE